MTSILTTALAAGALLMTAACASAPAAAPPVVDYTAIVETTDRPEADIVADANRRPAEILALFAPQPGDTILEIEAGAGYFTELLSRAVGETGTVYMQNPAAFDGFLGDTLTKRLGGRLANVTYLESNFDTFALEDGAADIVTWFQGPHELWYTPEGATEGLGDPGKSFAEIARALKPGGQFVVIDHVAPAGSPATTGGETHRIDPAIIRTRAEAAGLLLASESGLLRNPADDGLKNVFDPEIRGKTDQVILIFRKP